jgi:hypothetical protein
MVVDIDTLRFALAATFDHFRDLTKMVVDIDTLRFALAATFDHFRDLTKMVVDIDIDIQRFAPLPHSTIFVTSRKWSSTLIFCVLLHCNI